MAKQEKIAVNVEHKIESIEDFRFEPIKGYPMLNWKGKRPFNSTQFYPAQLKESHGVEQDGWLNKIFWGDNLQVMSHLLKSLRGQVDLVYIDPPFDSKADYKKKIALKGKALENDLNGFEEKQYTDIWSNDEYLQFIYERLILIRELLSDTGTLYFHCDWHKSHQLRCILDEIFGPSNFRNEIAWQRTRSSKFQSTFFSIVHDTIFIYTKTDNFKFFPQYLPHREALLESHYNKIDEESGRRYTLDNFTQKGQGEPRKFGDKILTPPAGKHWIWSQERIDEGLKSGRIQFTSNGTPRLKRFLDETKGEPIQDIWIDIPEVNSQASERVGYPTQKPEPLLERILKASSEPGDIVFDCFMGSGTTQSVALKMGRRFIGADINLGSIQTTSKRLINISKDLAAKSDTLQFDIEKNTNEINHSTTGFQVYNVNHYDIFRNPLEAKELLIKALEIQPLPGSSLYDGEKDGYMVKIMPVNRIATRADLNELITGFDIKTFEKRNEQSPGKSVESILLVCMGHEPDLSAQLKNEVKAMGYNLDIEVVDILRDKSNLEFKRDSEIDVQIINNTVVIDQFYPMNLLQKLSLMKEDVGNWRELVDSVMIDFNYDGAIFEPTIVDVPEDKELVKGSYQIPASSGTIRVKITDLLSESLEVNING
ncbi:MAG: site-specific DNA-methyltransferase [Bacteroidota bacterium]